MGLMGLASWAYITHIPALEGAIRLKLVMEDPLASDDIDSRGVRHKIPSVILFHSRSPFGVG